MIKANSIFLFLVYQHQSMKKKQTRILLVDDEPDILEILAYNLTLKDIKLIKQKMV